VTDHRVEDLSPLVHRLTAVYGADRRSVIEAVARDAWFALRTIEDRADRLVTVERLTRIELNARVHAQQLSERDRPAPKHAVLASLTQPSPVEREDCMVHS
jgi:hypothetical protein